MTWFSIQTRDLVVCSREPVCGLHIDTRPFWEQVQACEFETLRGPGQHDDFLVSAALVTFLDQADWAPATDSEILPPTDPLAEVDGGPF